MRDETKHVPSNPFALARSALMLSLLVAIGCESGSPKQTTSPPPTQTDSPPSSQGALTMVEITAAESTSNNLPPVAITIDPGNLGMSIFMFPEDDMYLMLSGPPGGPLGLSLEKVSDMTGDEAGLSALVKSRFEGRTPQTGTTGQVSLSGGEHPAITCTTDSSGARSHHLLVLFDVPDSSDGILLDFWLPAGDSDTPIPGAMFTQADFDAMLRSLTVRFH